ncbi:MAG: hypothetical protein WC919_01525 [Candidatus Paceibacterota bacterium]|jgi:hypothetical protein
MVLASDNNKITLLPNTHPEQYQLVTLMVATPSDHPNKAAQTQARPFEFEFDLPSRLSAMCPFCCAGFYVYSSEILEQYGYKFVACPECGVGKPETKAPPPPFIDPFVNPFSSNQLTRCELDETVTSVNNIPDDDSLTVAQKMSRAKCKE